MESPLVSKVFVKHEAEHEFFTYRLDLAYIGTDFNGWQSQPDGRTVQDHLEKSLRLILRQDLRVVGASRTDSGVHAEHQVATFRIRREIDVRSCMRSLTGLLPNSIGVLSLRRVDSDFHPIIHAKAKVYRYRIWLGRNPLPFVRQYVWSLPGEIDLLKIQTASQSLLGFHDFKSFCATDGSARTFERTILDMQWIKRGQLLELYILGDGFLKQMVRNIVGTLLEIGLGKRPATDIERILIAKDRRQAGQTAEAQGLALLRIFFEPQFKIPVALMNQGNEFGFLLNYQ